MYLCTVGMHINNLGDILFILHLRPYLYAVVFMSLAYEICVLDTSSFYIIFHLAAIFFSPSVTLEPR